MNTTNSTVLLLNLVVRIYALPYFRPFSRHVCGIYKFFSAVCHQLFSLFLQQGNKQKEKGLHKNLVRYVTQILRYDEQIKSINDEIGDVHDVEEGDISQHSDSQSHSWGFSNSHSNLTSRHYDVNQSIYEKDKNYRGLIEKRKKYKKKTVTEIIKSVLSSIDYI